MTLPGKSYCLDQICPYLTRFELDFAREVLKPSTTSGLVLDPFCGCGTTLFAARLAGLSSRGLDSSPVATAISRAKLVTVRPECVIERAAEILWGAAADVTLPTGRFWHLCFSPEVLLALCRLRRHFSHEVQDDASRFLAALVAGLLHGPAGPEPRRYFSNHMPGSYAPGEETLVEYWTAGGLGPPMVDVLELVRQRAYTLLTPPLPVVSGTVVTGDSRDPDLYPSACEFERVLTSPPYFGHATFVADQWLRVWLLGDPPEAAGHVRQDNLNVYRQDLARVWRNCAMVCRPNASLVVRYGVTRAHAEIDPRSLLESTLELADAGWIVEGCSPISSLRRPRPASFPFPPPADRPLHEFNLFARLNK